MKKRKKQNKSQDPYFEREKLKYENPIPSREFILEYLEKLGVPESYPKLLQALKLRGPKNSDALHHRLKAMVRDGQLITDRKERYALVKKMNLVRGYVVGHRDGYGFLTPDSGGKDLFLNPKEMRAVFPGDIVLASVISSGENDKREGAIVEVLTRKFTQIIGRYFIERGIGFIVPSNRDFSQEIIIPHGKELKAKKGDLVLTEILGYPTKRNSATAKVIKILGKEVTPALEIDVVVNAHGLPNSWPDKAAKESNAIAQLGIKAEKRVDLRKLPFVTIDGADAKDFDDAVYCKKDNGAWILYVAIADVSHYVTFNSALDQEALNRGNSVYFPGQVIPMLPEILSNELCSLKPEVDRLVVVAEVKINNLGKIDGFKFYDAIIRSHARLTYDKVFDLLENNSEPNYLLLSELKNLRALYLLLLKQRKIRGSLDFSRVESKIIFNPQGKISKIVKNEHHYVHGMIEECMLVANVCASKFLLTHKISALYRVHEGPELEKLSNVRAFLKSLGLELKGGENPKSIHYADLLQKIIGRTDEHLVQTVLLRSMRQAVYTPSNIGHFGLAYEEYAHFTSPIRRYPDLINHRSIKYILLHGNPSKYHYNEANMQEFGNHCSMTERRADDASRDVELWHKCQFMRDKLGKSFAGIISGVMNFGIFVELKDIFIEGLVHITALKQDYYQFDQLRQRLVGKRGGKVYRLGDEVKVLVARVDLDELEISLELV